MTLCSVLSLIGLCAAQSTGNLQPSQYGPLPSNWICEKIELTPVDRTVTIVPTPGNSVFLNSIDTDTGIVRGFMCHYKLEDE